MPFRRNQRCAARAWTRQSARHGTRSATRGTEKATRATSLSWRTERLSEDREGSVARAARSKSPAVRVPSARRASANSTLARSKSNQPTGPMPETRVSHRISGRQVALPIDNNAMRVEIAEKAAHVGFDDFPGNTEFVTHDVTHRGRRQALLEQFPQTRSQLIEAVIGAL